MENIKVGFLFLLVCTIFLPSINYVYADPVPNVIVDDEIIHATTDSEVLNGGLIINQGGELIVDSGATLLINGAVIVSGKITVDGSLSVNGLVVNSGEVYVRCGELIANVIGKFVIEGGCEEPNQIIGDLIITSKDLVVVPQDKVVDFIGTVIIKQGGRLHNFGTIENFGKIILEGGVLLTTGIINSYCSNFDGHSIDGKGVILGGGIINKFSCSAPIADDDAYLIYENEILVIAAPGVLEGDTDADSPILTASLLTDTLIGSTQLNPDGSFTYIPDTDFSGTEQFVYQVSDGDGGNDVGIVTIDVLSVNNSPVADNDDIIVNEDDGFLDITDLVLNGDTDIDKLDVLTIISADSTSSAIGQVVVGSLLYNPNGEFETLGIGETGIDIFDYTISDGNGGTATAIVTVTINGQNDAPIGNNDNYSVNEDNILTITAPGVLVNDSDIEEDALTSIIDTTTDNGVLVLGIDGSFTYTPDPDFNGSDSFTYHVNDGLLDSNIATVAITIIDVSDQDTTDPIITPPLGITVEATSPSPPGSIVDLGTATAKDDVDLFPLITSNAPVSFNLGNTIVTWTATDASGNSASATQLVILVDTTDPIIIPPAEVRVTIEGTEISAFDVDLGTATAKDDVDLFPLITNDIPVSFNLGNTIVTWTATDASGNSASATQLVILKQISLSLLDEKTEKILELENLISEDIDKKTVKELEKGVKELKKSVESKKWGDNGNTLDDKEGKKVFKEQEKGVKHILKILKNNNESDEFIFNLATILLEIVDIDEKLVDDMLQDAINSDGSEKCLNKAEDELNKGIDDENNYKFDKAIKHYGKVWENSQKAINGLKCGK